MGVQSSFYGVNGDLTTFPQTKHIQNKDYVRVYVRQKIDSVWILYDATKYDVINNAIVFGSPIDPTIYDMIEIRIADSVDELQDSISDIAIVAANIVDINTVADNINDVNNFGKTYYGSLISDPTARPDGTTMQSGDLYFNTTVREMRVYDGTVWKTSTDSYTKTEADSIFIHSQNGFYTENDIRFTVDTIASFRLMSETPKFVYVSGYHAKDDGAFGEAFFKLREGVVPNGTFDNGGTVIETVNGVYDLQYKGPINIKWFGAKGDGVSDDTQAMHAAVACVLSSPTYLYSTATYTRRVEGFSGKPTLYFPEGEFVYNGNGIDVGNGIACFSAGTNESAVKILSDSYLFISTQIPNFMYLHSIKSMGGKGLYFNYNDLVTPQLTYKFINCVIIDFSAVGIGSIGKDSPRWTISGCHILTTKPNTKGVLFPPGTANPDLTNTTIVGCTYKLVFSAPHQSSEIVEGLTMYSLPEDDHEADIWLMTHETTINAGQGFIIRGNRFSGENARGKPKVLIAANAGLSLEGAYHSTNITTQFFRGLQFINNICTGEGTTDTGGPVIESYTARIGRMRVQDNVLNRAFNYILFMHDNSPIGYTSDSVIGPNIFTDGYEDVVNTNIDTLTVKQSEGKVLPNKVTEAKGFGYCHNKNTMSKINAADVAESKDLIPTNATLTAIADSLGGTNAVTVSMTTTIGYVQIPINSVAFSSSGLVHTKLQLRKSATLSVKSVKIEIIAYYASGGNKTYINEYMLTDEWRTVYLPMSVADSLIGFSVRIYGVTSDITVENSFDIGRFYVHSGESNLNTDTVFLGLSAWNGSKIYFEGPNGQQAYIFPDWTNNVFRCKFGAEPSSEIDGTIL